MVIVIEFFCRYLRNRKQRNDAKEEFSKIAHGRLESQVFHVRSPQPPDLLVFHPFDSHLAVACKDYVGFVLLLLLSS